MISFDEFDEQRSPRPDNNDFSRLLDRALSRRSLLKGGAAFGVSAFVSGGASAAALVKNAQAADQTLLGFAPVAATEADTITVPPGYQGKPCCLGVTPYSATAKPLTTKPEAPAPRKSAPLATTTTA